MKLLHSFIAIDPDHILHLAGIVVTCAAKNGFTYDRHVLGETVNLIEDFIVNYKNIIYKKENFNSLLSILDEFSNSGQIEALELTWRLKEVF